MRPKDITAAMLAFKEAVKGEVATSSEIDRRERICAKCPKRRQSSGLTTKVSQFLGTLANKHRVPAKIRNYSCGVCKCSLMLLIPATPENFHKDSPEEAANRPDSCWMKP